MRPNAEVDLPWLFGTGPATAQGDCGLKSSLGGQLAAMAEGISRQPTVDASHAEDMMHLRMKTAAELKRIQARLDRLDDAHVSVLRLHYGYQGGKRRLMDALSMAALVCPTAREFVAPYHRKPSARELLDKMLAVPSGDTWAQWREHNKVKAKLCEAMLRASHAEQRAPAPVTREELRRATHESLRLKDGRFWVFDLEVTTMVGEAIRAYQDVVLPKTSMSWAAWQESKRRV